MVMYGIPTKVARNEESVGEVSQKLGFSEGPK